MQSMHINTDQMRQLGQLFVQLNEQIQSNIEPEINDLTGQLEGDWQGQTRWRFEQMYNDWRVLTERVIQIGEDLSQHLQNTAAQFGQADRSL